MPHGPQSRHTTTIAVAALTGLVLTACTGGTGDEGAAAPSTAAPSTTSPEDVPATTDPAEGSTSPGAPTLSPDAAPDRSQGGPVLTIDTPDLDDRCELETDRLQEIERISYSVPSAWRVEGRCDVLDPDLEALPEGTEVDAALFVSVSNGDVDRNQEDSPAQRDVTTWVGARAGFPVVRSTYVGTGEAMSEDGRPGTSWTYDLDPGADDGGGILTMSTGPVDGDDEYSRTKATIDAIAQTVMIEPPASQPATGPGDTEFQVVRTEGGGTPYSVGYDGDCFTLRPTGPGGEVTEQTCDLDPLAGDLVVGTLGDVVVGHASPLAVAVQSDDTTPPYGLTSAIEGSSVFAFRVDQVPEQLTAIGPGGEVLHTAPVG